MTSAIKEWVPVQGIPDTLYIEALTDGYSGLRVLLADEEKDSLFEVTFSSFYAYQNFDESERLKTLANITELTMEWSLFVAENTGFVKWLCQQSPGTLDAALVKHYIIATPTDILEILASASPTVQKLNPKQV